MSLSESDLRHLRVVLGVLLAGTLGIALILAAPADARPGRPGPRSIVFQGDCIDTPGHMTVRQVRRDGDRVALRMRVTGMQDRRWSGQASVLYGTHPSSGGQADPFEVRTPHGRARHTSVFGVPDGFTSVGVLLTDDAAGCQLSASHSPRSASVSMYDAQLSAAVDRRRVRVEYASRSCRGDATWRARVVATWPGRTVTRSLGSDDCLNGVVTLSRWLPGRRVPQALSIVARDDAGDDWRAAYDAG